MFLFEMHFIAFILTCPHTVVNNYQAIIRYCMENAKDDLASRIILRMYHKREDFANFSGALSNEQWQTIVGELKEYLKKIVASVDDASKVRTKLLPYFPLLRPRGLQLLTWSGGGVTLVQTHSAKSNISLSQRKWSISTERQTDILMHLVNSYS